jgi:hypothetical protein
MIKAGAKLENGRQLLVIGLSRRNTELLLEGKPIRIDPADTRLDGPIIVIMGGENEQAILDQLGQTVPSAAWESDPDVS